jgi:hypothetical protein
VARRDQERLRLAVARALLNTGRPLVLADNPLLDQPAVARLARERYARMALGAELALGDLVRQAGELVLARLGDDPRLGRERAVLQTVLAGGSVGAAARALGQSREHISNTAWRTATGWVLEALGEVCAEGRPERGGGLRRISALPDAEARGGPR